MRKRLLCLALTLQLLLLCCAPGALAGYTTLRPGKTYSEDVKKMQAALISLGFLGGSPDGIFGNNTENAVRKFQRKYRLGVDGLAGDATLTKLYSLIGQDSASAETARVQTDSSQTQKTEAAAETETKSAAAQTETTVSRSASSSSSGLFGGNYATLRINARGDRVRKLQQALISLKYLGGSADGVFGVRTRQAVIAFQKAYGLSTDGLAGRKTLLALEKAVNGSSSSSSSASSSSSSSAAAAESSSGSDSSSSGSGSSSSGSASSSTVASASVGSVKLLHWYNDIKNTLRSKQNLVIVDPSTGISWTLRLYSLGRHADAEPLTAEDTANMLEAFGGKNTWSQKAVYVKLPNGTWTIGSTHDMPHMSGSIDDNNFNGHLCVHFLRDMDECKEKDPSYGVSNQKTIRAFWKKLTGEEIP